MTAEPLRSARSIGNHEDTSLALPSDSTLRSGQQRVLDQVHTIKRTKSKPGKNASLSPSSPSLQGPALLSEFGSFKFSPAKSNGTLRSNSTTAANFSKAESEDFDLLHATAPLLSVCSTRAGSQRSLPAVFDEKPSVGVQKSRSLSSKTMDLRKGSSSSHWEQRFHTSSWPQPPNGLKPSRSDPALVPPFSPTKMPPMQFKSGTLSNQQSRNSKGYFSVVTDSTKVVTNQTRTVRPPSARSQTDIKGSVSKITKTDQQQGVNGELTMPDLTLKEAVEFLSHPEENYQLCGASFIQHATYNEDNPKKEVLALGGIAPLVVLLQSPNPAVSQSASAALRNLVFKYQANKLEVQHCGGIGKALLLLRDTDSSETQKQLTGLLWNLSSAEELKSELIATALPVLTESVVTPFTCWSDSSANNNVHPDVFYSATGCLRNLSCAQQKDREARQAMRDCRGLVDSIMTYIQACVAEDNPDDKSVENCACILHNLTYQLETESPACFARFSPQGEGSAEDKKGSTVGCFSPKSSKIQKEVQKPTHSFPVSPTRSLQPGIRFPLAEEGPPSGASWLCHSKAMTAYLSLLASSQKDATLEACCGALQNLTANKGPVSNAMGQMMVQKLGGLVNISHLLKAPNPSLQKAAMSLLGNLSRTTSLQGTMARQLLPDLSSLLSSGTREMGNSDDTMATACHTARSLLVADPEVSKKVVSNELVTSLADLSENRSFPKASKAASLLLYSIWNEKGLQGPLKKLGMSKSLFINDVTTAAHKSVQVIE
ncbi:plakophilin-1 [Aplochiton taeniatus]